MAVYTEVSDEALTRFLARYDIGTVVSFKGIAGGVENTNYLLQTDRDAYILTLYEKRVAEEDLPFFVGLMDHLAVHGFPCPQPVRDLDGKALGRLQGRPAAIVSFLPGVEITTPAPTHCERTGRAMAQLHAAAQDFELVRPNALAWRSWPALAKEGLPEADGVEEGLAELIRDELAVLGEKWPQDLPAGVIHADMFRDNVFFLDGALSGVIDFYFACNDYLAYDLAIAINAWCFDRSLKFDPTLSAALIAGYQAQRRLEHAELEALPLLCRGAALRFLLTRLNDWLNVPPGALVVPHDPREFSGRLRFHRQIETPEIYGAA